MARIPGGDRRGKGALIYDLPALESGQGIETVSVSYARRNCATAAIEVKGGALLHSSLFKRPRPRTISSLGGPKENLAND
jgi:hypothetical protein